MTPVYEIQFLQALALTLAIEIPCLWVLLRLLIKLDKKNYSLPLIFGIGFLASFSTLPYVWFILPVFLHKHLVYAICAETGVFIIEAIIYTALFRLNWKQGALLSLLCNGLSFGIGELIKAIL